MVTYLPGFTLFDLVALIWFLGCSFGYGFATRHGPLSARGVSRAMDEHRRSWMRNMAQRENRMVDIQVLANLSRGNTFFASTAVFVTGALAALFGTVEELQLLASKFPFLRQTTVFMWQLKVLFLMGIFILAFFKFAWAFRLSNNTAIMIGATPIASAKNKKQCEAHAERAAKLASLVGHHGNAGMRAYYFGIAGLCWCIHPSAFMLATLWVVGVLYRREYRSRAYLTISGDAAASNT